MVDMKLTNSEILVYLVQAAEILNSVRRIREFALIFPHARSVTTAMTRRVEMGTTPTMLYLNRLNPQNRGYLKAEVDYMLKHGINRSI